MIARVAAAFVALAAATATVGATAVIPRGQCNTGPVQCCNSVHSSSSDSSKLIISLLALDVKDVVGDIGLGCSPINVVGVSSGNACSTNTVCCQNNSVGGLINIGCVPVSL
ncbi:fungal hydrophobin-domain-containing protein [Lenzites betulinus]|nr:fungal hydrophobin-domain-containing protein [Lenzites betulinus]